MPKKGIPISLGWGGCQDTVPVDWTDGIHLNQDSSNGVTENLRHVLSVICKISY